MRLQFGLDLLEAFTFGDKGDFARCLSGAENNQCRTTEKFALTSSVKLIRNDVTVVYSYYPCISFDTKCQLRIGFGHLPAFPVYGYDAQMLLRYRE